jgi:hypothetical protein
MKIMAWKAGSSGSLELAFEVGHGWDDSLNFIVECTAQKKKDKEAKVATAKSLWVPAVKNHREFGAGRFGKSVTRGTRRMNFGRSFKSTARLSPQCLQNSPSETSRS